MKKSELKSGMLVQVRNGQVYMFINDAFAGITGYLGLNNYKDDLTHEGSEYGEWDIIKASKPMSGHRTMPEQWNKEELNDNLYWERPTPFRKGDRVKSTGTSRVVLVSGKGYNDTNFAGVCIEYDGNAQHSNCGEYSTAWAKGDFTLLK